MVANTTLLIIFSIAVLGTFAIISIVAFVVAYARSKKTKQITPVFYKKLANSDESIGDVIDYLELTNSKYLKNNGEDDKI